MPTLRQARRGVAGFFEEVPAAVVAIISLVLFFAAVLTAFANYSSQQQSSSFSEQAETFLEGLLSYQNLTFHQQSGVFDVHKMMSLTSENLTYNFHPPFQYTVTITDISQFLVKYDKTLSTSSAPASQSSLHAGSVSESTTVDLWVPNFPNDEYHSATLNVVIWE
jgi:hypothetical protein